MSQEWADCVPASAQVFNKMLLAIDGWVMWKRMPTKREVSNSRSSRNRKGMWGIVVLAGCDANTKFHLWNASNTGSTIDCTAWDRCGLKLLIDQGRWPDGYYVLGDEAFSCMDYFLVPWGGSGLGVANDTFNFHLSARRQTIERERERLVL
jgi:hypothetical protein